MSHRRRGWTAGLVLAAAAGCGGPTATPESLLEEPPPEPIFRVQDEAAVPLPLAAPVEIALASAETSFVRRPYRAWEMREAAADALGRIGEPAVPELVRMLQDPDPALRRQAADVLARIGPRAGAAVPQLTLALDDADPQVRRSAARALGQIGPDAAAAVPTLMRILREDEEPAMLPP